MRKQHERNGVFRDSQISGEDCLPRLNLHFIHLLALVLLFPVLVLLMLLPAGVGRFCGLAQ
jgi:hypothetical protein